MKTHKFTAALLLIFILTAPFVTVAIECTAPNNRLANGSFELVENVRINGQWVTRVVGWETEGNASIGRYQGYQECGNYYGLLTNHNDYNAYYNPLVKVYQDVVLEDGVTSVTLTIFAGKHSDCYTDIRLVFLNSSGNEIPGATQTKEVTRIVSDSKGLAAYTLQSLVPAGAKKVRVEGRTQKQKNKKAQYLKLEGAVLLFKKDDTLPVELADFSAQGIENQVVLQWETTAELNAGNFDIEHSDNGSNWRTIGTVGAKGDYEGLSTYQFLHDSPASGINYYRLKMIDRDGDYEYSKIVNTLVVGQTSTASLYPNPCRDKIFFATPGRIKDIMITDLSGTSLMRLKALNAGSELDLSFLNNGIYLIRWVVDDRRHTERLLISR